MSEIFVISDTHFAHQKIIEYCKRPWATAAEMDKELIKRWNDVVSPRDTVYHLGDFAFDCEDLYRIGLAESLNGFIRLIRGNHDHDHRLQKMRFESVKDYDEIKWNKKLIVLFHYPMRSWKNDGHGSWHLYGHTHGTLPPHGKSADVGVDAIHPGMNWNYRPIHLSEIEKFMVNRPALQFGEYQGTRSIQ